MAQSITLLTDREADLLLRLETLFPPEQTEEYQNLCRRSDQGQLTDVDRERLPALIQLRDEQNTGRLEIVGELARLRGVSVRQVMADSKIAPA